MPCYFTRDSKGNGAIVCTRGTVARRKCIVCGEPTNLLCDGRVGLGTCDAPICPKHSHHVTPGKDYCSKHWWSSK